MSQHQEFELAQDSSGEIQKRQIEELGPPINESGQVTMRSVTKSDVPVLPEHGGGEDVKKMHGVLCYCSCHFIKCGVTIDVVGSKTTGFTKQDT